MYKGYQLVSIFISKLIILKFFCSPHPPPLSNKNCMKSSNNIDHLLLNLTLCDIMVSLASTSTLQTDSGWLDMIRKFVTDTLQDGSKLTSKQVNRLLGVTWRLMQIQQNKGKMSSFWKAKLLTGKA